MLALLEAARNLILVVIFSLFGLEADDRPDEKDAAPESQVLERLVR
ncbi:MAG: hypothetical protein GVY06_04015 [Alphaproteobacteria bacterium]|jgi:hypothetical protein|nr:hypothetical protein [Alphaproteobacteria bacterium]